MGNQVGEQFARALAAKDADGLKRVLRTDVDFRAMTPSRFWESNDASAVVDDIILGTWFGPTDRITELIAVDTDDVGTRERMGYRLKVTNADGDYVVEQQAYFETDGDRISWLRIMCAGFMPDPA